MRLDTLFCVNFHITASNEFMEFCDSYFRNSKSKISNTRPNVFFYMIYMLLTDHGVDCILANRTETLYQPYVFFLGIFYGRLCLDYRIEEMEYGDQNM